MPFNKENKRAMIMAYFTLSMQYKSIFITNFQPTLPIIPTNKNLILFKDVRQIYAFYPIQAIKLYLKFKFTRYLINIDCLRFNAFALIYIQEMSQRHYSPDQLVSASRKDSRPKTKRLRQGGSTTKLLESASRFIEDQVIIGDYKYKVSDQIGAGYSSRVYRGSGKDKNEYAVKVIDMKRFSASGLEMLENEIEILKKLNHPNIIRLFHVHRTQTHTYLVTQLCKGGDLLQFMAKKGRLSEEASAVIMSDVIEGVKYLMQAGIIHRDIKPANILKSDKIWKIADFGFSIQAKEETRTRQNVGTPLYMPIQSLLKNIYSPESDIFAVGVMYYELLVGVTPWECRSQKELIKKLATLPFSVPEKYKLSSHIKYLLNKMCSVDKSTRMQRDQFEGINLKNFISLNNFNDPLTVSQKIQSNRKNVVHSPANKIKRSKSKNKPQSKEKGKVQKEYKLGRRKKSTEKVASQARKKSVEKEAISVKTYTVKNQEGSTFPSLLPESELSVDRFEVINEKILTNQLDYCRFIYYLLLNSRQIPLRQESRQLIVMILYKHLIKLIKQLADVKHNFLKLPHWDTFKQSQRCKHLVSILSDYCEKYEREYLKHLKEANVQVIREVNQKFNELGSPEAISLSFYCKVQALVKPALKECLLVYQQNGEGSKGSMEGIRSLFGYYRWVQMNVHNFENYAIQRNAGVTIVKNFKSSQITNESFQVIMEEIKAL